MSDAVQVCVQDILYRRKSGLRSKEEADPVHLVGVGALQSFARLDASFRERRFFCAPGRTIWLNLLDR